MAAGFDADQTDIGVVYEGVEDAHGVAAASDAGNHHVRQATDLFGALPLRLTPDDRLELADHQRVRMRAEHRSQEVVAVGDGRDPVAHRFVDGVLERPAAGVHSAHGRAEQLHPEDVERLPLHVFRAHVDVARQPEQRAGGGGRDAVLPCAGFRDDAPLAHPLREERLAERVVDLVRAGVREILALEKDARAAERSASAAAPRRAASGRPT